jgi:hypothetical protein
MLSSTFRPSRLLFLALAALAGFALVRPDLLERLRGPGETLNPCDSPLAWHIRAVDARFGFTRQELEAAVEEAARVWEEAAGRRFFRHDTAASMAIDLVYDGRQEEYEWRRNREAELRTLTEQVESLGSLLERLDARVEDARIRHEQRATAATADAYRSAVDRYNLTAEEYNRVVSRHNAALERLQADGPTEYTAGDLQWDNRTLGGRVVSTERVLTVAVAGGYEELVVVLAHELGHALGLGHVAAPGALMAERYRQGDVALPVRLASGDRRALAELCGWEG